MKVQVTYLKARWIASGESMIEHDMVVVKDGPDSLSEIALGLRGGFTHPTSGMYIMPGAILSIKEVE